LPGVDSVRRQALRITKRKSLLILLAVLAISQLIPINRSNPPVTAEIVAPPEVMSLLRRACYDCHSNETVWPWYSRVAPLSWLLAYDVSEGRHHLNFSRWGELSLEKKDKKLRETAEAIDEREMPPFYYLPAHPRAWLDTQAKTTLVNWAKQGNLARKK